MTYLARIWRHPIKSHGAEALESVTLAKGQCLPFDRHWAVAHEASDADGSCWMPCRNFTRGAKAPGLMAITAKLDEEAGQVTLSHPDLDDLSFAPDVEGDRLIAWSKPLQPENRAVSTYVVRVDGRGMTDTDFPSVSINSLSSLRDLSQKAGTDLSPRRFRGNLWLDDVPAWEEFNWIGKTLCIGGAKLEIVEPIGRCLATTANPDTGQRDVQTLNILNTHYGHQDFGVYARVIKSGPIAISDQIKVIS